MEIWVIQYRQCYGYDENHDVGYVLTEEKAKEMVEKLNQQNCLKTWFRYEYILLDPFNESVYLRKN